MANIGRYAESGRGPLRFQKGSCCGIAPKPPISYDRHFLLDPKMLVGYVRYCLRTIESDPKIKNVERKYVFDSSTCRAALGKNADAHHLEIAKDVWPKIFPENLDDASVPDPRVTGGAFFVERQDNKQALIVIAFKSDYFDKPLRGYSGHSDAELMALRSQFFGHLKRLFLEGGAVEVVEKMNVNTGIAFSVRFP